MSNELKVELSCGRCNFTKVITIGTDEDGVFTIPNKFCPNDLSELSREVLRNFVPVPSYTLVQPVPKKPDEPDDTSKKAFELTKNIKKSNAKTLQEVRSGLSSEPTEDKARTSNAISKSAGILDVPKHGANRPKKT